MVLFKSADPLILVYYKDKQTIKYKLFGMVQQK